MKKVTILIFLLFNLFLQSAFADRLKDLVSIAGIRTNQLLGYGIVIGLNGTGDSTTNLTLQSIQSLISQFDIVVSTSDLTAKNAAAVMVTADLPAFSKPGQTFILAPPPSQSTTSKINLNKTLEIFKHVIKT